MDATGFVPQRLLAARASGCVIGALACCSAILHASSAFGADSTEPQALATSNTSVSVEELRPDAVPVSDSTGPHASSTLPPKASSSQTAGASLRPPGADARRDLSHPEPRPWYRSATGSLLIVLGIIAAAAWFVRRMVPSFRVSETSAMTVLTRAPVSQRQTLALVQVGRRVIVVGLSPGRVDRLAEIDDPCEVAELVARADGRHAGGLRFNNLLEEQAGNYAAPPDVDRGDLALESPPTPVSALLRRLKMLQRSA